MEQTTNQSSTADRELTATRIIDASPEAIFAVIANPGRLARWWGPKGFTNTFEQFEFKPGGNWRFVMHGPDGGNYKNQSVFLEIQEPDRVVLKHVNPPHFQLTIGLQREAGKTKITWKQLFETVTEYQNVSRFAVEANEQNLDRLEAELARDH